MNCLGKIAPATTTHGPALVADRYKSGVLDTCTYIDLGQLDAEFLPEVPEITAITMAELQQGVAMAKNAITRAARTELLGTAIAEFDPLPFDGEAAARYGTLTALTTEARRDPGPRRLDLMIAAIASVHDLPLFTRNVDDFAGIEDMVTVIAI
jgi:predicted nucleic acid-binding protein